jgi:hypothetical protein
MSRFEKPAGMPQTLTEQGVSGYPTLSRIERAVCPMSRDVTLSVTPDVTLLEVA